MHRVVSQDYKAHVHAQSEPRCAVRDTGLPRISVGFSAICCIRSSFTQSDYIRNTHRIYLRSRRFRSARTSPCQTLLKRARAFVHGPLHILEHNALLHRTPCEEHGCRIFGLRSCVLVYGRGSVTARPLHCQAVNLRIGLRGGLLRQRRLRLIRVDRSRRTRGKKSLSETRAECALAPLLLFLHSLRASSLSVTRKCRVQTQRMCGI
jgi:hypothetical protein